MPSTPRYEVVWSDAAAGDFEGLFQFIAIENPVNAANACARIKKRADALHHLPQRGRGVPELKAIGLDLYREIVIDPYRLLYRIKDRNVWVLGLFDGRRDLEDVLLDRLTRPPV